jgi:hypothetical protein
MAHLTEDDILNAKIAAMGSELGELHFLLWKDVTWLHFEWQEFRELFGTQESRIDLMNKTAPRFFSSLERVLWQDILLSLSRLIDPPGTGGQQNLTFGRLLPLVTPVLRDRLVAALNEYEAKAAFAREWRHRRYAHRELSHAANSSANALAPGSRASVEDALASAGTLMNLLELEYQQSTIGYEHAWGSENGALALLEYLALGLQADDERGDLSPRRPRFT